MARRVPAAAPPDPDSSAAPREPDRSVLERILRADRYVVATGLLGVTLVAWAYTVAEATRMDRMEIPAVAGMTMPALEPWTPAQALTVFVMWAVMMVGMMVPSAAPMVLLFAALNRKKRAQRRPFVPTGLFLGGYLTVWTLFSAAATLAQWGLHRAALLSPTMVATSPIVGAVVLAAAGVYQWTPLKSRCLQHCRAPISFLSAHWRDGFGGAFAIGLHHGVYCVGCCWLLMALLFFVGVMNLTWVALIAAFVLAEKIVPPATAPWVSRIAGAVLIVWAGVVLRGA